MQTDLNKQPVRDDRGTAKRKMDEIFQKQKLIPGRFNYLETAITHSPTSIVITDADGRIEYVNPKFCEVTGYSVEEALGQNPQILKSNLHSDEFYKEMWDTISSGKMWRSEFRNKKKNGELYWEMSSIAPIFDDDGKIIKYIAIKEEITERKKIEEKLRQSEEKYRKIFDHFEDLYFQTDMKGTIVMLSPSVVPLTGYEMDELIGTSVLDVYHNPKERSKFLRTMLLEKHVVNYELKLLRKDGKVLDVFISARIEYDSGGKPEFISGIIHDFTELKRTQDELEKLIEEMQVHRDEVDKRAFEINQLNIRLSESEEDLRQLNATKDKFFSIIAHDLRGPFSGFIGLSELMEQEYANLDSKAIAQISKSMSKSAKKLYNLLENLLEWSKAQMSRIELKPITIDLYDFAKRISGLFLETALQKKIDLTVDISRGTFIVADSNMLNTILRNLISNALKFTPENGKIVVSALDDGEKIIISVTDTGIGMSQEDMNKLFRIDVHHSTIGTSEEKGTGLGLILCKDFVDKCRGEIWVESELGKGSSFKFTMPKEYKIIE